MWPRRRAGACLGRGRRGVGAPEPPRAPARLDAEVPGAERIRADIAIALGSNLGASRALFESALERLAGSVGDLRASPFYRTPAVGRPGSPAQPDYLNGAAIGTTDRTPDELLAVLKAIERLAGRESAPRWSARPLDLDLLLYGERRIERPELTIPHPRLTERAFYLVPLAAIAPGWLVPPTDRTVREHLAALPAADRREVVVVEG